MQKPHPESRGGVESNNTLLTLLIDWSQTEHKRERERETESARVNRKR